MDVRRVVLERRTWETVTLSDFPRFSGRSSSDAAARCREIGFFEVIELDARPPGAAPPHDRQPRSSRRSEAQERAGTPGRSCGRSISGWYELICARLSSVDGRSIELGSGIGTLRRRPRGSRPLTSRRLPGLAPSSTRRHCRTRRVRCKPRAVDVFHHLARPASSSTRPRECWFPGAGHGPRPVLLTISAFAYRRFHHERTDLRRPPSRTTDDSRSPAGVEPGPLDASLLPGR